MCGIKKYCKFTYEIFNTGMLIYFRSYSFNGKTSLLKFIKIYKSSLISTYKGANTGKGRTDRLKYYYAGVAQGSTAPDL